MWSLAANANQFPLARRVGTGVAPSMMPGCASRTVGRWRTPLQVIPRTQWAKGARHRTHLAYLVRLVTPAARTTQWRERLIPVTAIAPPPYPVFVGQPP